MDWDVEPTAFEEWVTNQGDSPQLLFSSDDGFATSDPLAGRSYAESQSVCGGPNYVGSCEFTDLGTGGEYPTVTAPADHGGLFDFGFGALAPGAERTFSVYYGAAPSEQEALDALATGGVQVYSMGQPNCTGDTIATCSNGTAGDSGPEEGKLRASCSASSPRSAISRSRRPTRPVPCWSAMSSPTTSGSATTVPSRRRAFR